MFILKCLLAVLIIILIVIRISRIIERKIEVNRTARELFENQLRKEEKEQYLRETYPLIYDEKAADKRFPERIRVLKKTLDSVEVMDCTGMQSVTEIIKQNISYIEGRLKNIEFNALIRKNPGALDKALSLLENRLADSEKAGDILVTAIIYQECGDGKAFSTALHDAGAILAKQHDDQMLLQV